MTIEEIIENTVRNSVRNFFDGKEVKTTHVLDKIFPVERRIRSLIGGLETSLGTRLWEPLAKAFAEHNGFEVLDEKEFNNSMPTQIPASVSLILNNWISKREQESETTIDGFLDELREELSKIDTGNIPTGKILKGEGLDIWLRKDGVEYLYDIKTNQINAGGGAKFNTCLMRWYTYRLMNAPETNLRCQVAFPFNPHSGDFWAKEKGKAAPLIPKVDAVVGNEFWAFLLGRDDAWETIVSTFEKLGDENFGDEFQDIFKEGL